jgi:hypothetical protein
MSQLLARFAVPLGLAAITLQSALYDVPGGYRAVMFDRFSGVRNEATSEGTHFLVPWLQRAILYDVRVKPRVSGGAWGVRRAGSAAAAGERIHGESSLVCRTCQWLAQPAAAYAAHEALHRPTNAGHAEHFDDDGL